MSNPVSDSSFGDINALLQQYFDGLYDGDLEKFGRVFHPKAHLYATDGEALTDLTRADYFDMIAKRASPQAQFRRGISQTT